MISDMKARFPILLTLSLSWAVLTGCERNPPTETAPKTNPVSGPKNGIANQSAPDSRADMAYIAGGKFMMGDKEEVDALPHEVLVSPFYIDKNLITQEQYQKLMSDNPSRWKSGQNPVEQVRWSDAVKFCNKRSWLVSKYTATLG